MEARELVSYNFSAAIPFEQFCAANRFSATLSDAPKCATFYPALLARSLLVAAMGGVADCGSRHAGFSWRESRRRQSVGGNASSRLDEGFAQIVGAGLSREKDGRPIRQIVK